MTVFAPIVEVHPDQPISLMQEILQEVNAALGVALQENDYGSISEGVVLTEDFGSIAA